jgi:N-acetylmuramoyl-L-alanine amidase
LPAIEQPKFITPGRRTVPAQPVDQPLTAESKPEQAAQAEISTTQKRAKSGERKAQKPSKERQEHFTLITIVSTMRSLIVTFAAAVVAATVFMWWTSPDFIAAPVRGALAPVQRTAERSAATPTGLPTPPWFNRIGVLAGHSGKRGENIPDDPGAVCPDGFFEASVTLNVAKQVVALLQGRGYTVDLLEEYDNNRLNGYQAAAFISLHADSCEDFNDGFNHSGFKVTYPTTRFTARERDEALNDCVRQNYAGVTGLPFTPGSITENMTQYHAFRKLAGSTPAVILELGFLSYDRDLLQNRSDRVAQGIVNGLLCFVEPVALATNQPLGTPVPTASPGAPLGTQNP